ncbi:MAG: hypothetical protein HC866_05075 [Leptolyngbyaceae cyanobacterium RU_5_1]|nr:hypothetical protein [Leptolyngbyaceae cyanobacterium RU_5_1]
MFQDASINPVFTNLPKQGKSSRQLQGSHGSERSAGSSHFVAESYADRLMDDLFEDVDKLLDQDAPRPTEPIPVEEPLSEPTPPPPVDRLPQPVLPLAPRSESPFPSQPVEPEVERALAKVPSSNTATDIAAGMAAKLAAPLERFRQLSGAYDRLLLVACCASVIVPTAIWLIHKYAQRPPVAAMPSSQTAASSAAQPPNPFADYMLRSLNTLDRRSHQGVSQDPAGTSGDPNLPTVTVPKAATSPPPRVSTGLERVYVPVYQLPPNLAPPAAGTAIAPLPNLSPAVKPKAVKPKNSAKKSPFPPSTAASDVTRRLAGVLDQGDRSVALFETNGITQRYEIGESIGSSGWTLVEVAQNQAIIRRNGEVRSVFVGQSF